MDEKPYFPKHHVRFVTASSLFDGHDASINIMRRILQASGVEVIHLGHNRSVAEVVKAAIEEDVQAIAISSYQGGHVEYFRYMIDLLRTLGASHIHVFGGGGGVIVKREIDELHEYGVTRIYSPEDGRLLGLQGMINEMIRISDHDTPCTRALKWAKEGIPENLAWNHQDVAEIISLFEDRESGAEFKPLLLKSIKECVQSGKAHIPVVGLTGTGGSGKSSLTDELTRRFLTHFPSKRIAILSVDPTRQKTGGALLGDRIRMNAIDHPNVYMRSFATRSANSEISLALRDAIEICRAARFDLILVETSGIGQGDAAVVSHCDISIYVMTSEFGAPSQLEKIDMLDYADFIAINKFERRGSMDALRDVRKQLQRNRGWFEHKAESLPVYGTMASSYRDEGVQKLFYDLVNRLAAQFDESFTVENHAVVKTSSRQAILSAERQSYLLDVVKTIKQYKANTKAYAETATAWFQIEGTRQQLLHQFDQAAIRVMEEKVDALRAALPRQLVDQIEGIPALRAGYAQDEYVTNIRGREIRTPLFVRSLSNTRIPKVALPSFRDYGEWVRFLREENVPGAFPFTAGVFSFKRTEEEPRRQFAGEGTPERTNRRFHYLSQNDTAKRLSTAFDSVTLYGEDPAERPDIYGKIGESGVSVCTLDDMNRLFAGFDLTDPSTSVSMTINGPAPILLAMFFNTAIRQQEDAFIKREGRDPLEHEREKLKWSTLRRVRGTVQADILKEDQGQNTCIFSTDFALRMMGDIQQYFVDHSISNYYSVSISGYHIAEAGANPISQLAFTLSNAFTYVEYYLSRGMKIDDFAGNLSFFFSNGMDPEYTVMGRVARRIWAVAMRDFYGGSERSQKLKYHIQTSGRSLHAQEIDFNDIRTTLQALLAIYDNCNSLHTNAYDEAITTPTEESVRRAMAIQMIINREFGLTMNENPLQGSYLVEQLTDLVEEAVLDEFLRINDRGGVLGAMETQYQRGKIQEESLEYEMQKHSGALPIVGVNTFLRPGGEPMVKDVPLARATPEEKRLQIEHLRQFQERHRGEVEEAIDRLKRIALEGENLFAELMETVKVASLGQITEALYEVGGQYRRNM
ncbi:fused isobutyryl-CoA mutase/GTPase IcmF [Ferroacidibacillus organovorans]|uniref:Fused isobutyryl-CoA mutase n=1 Tax=Ferroacidibacillus organovorans TaxID=1765683 RepID=A0A101XQN3_9BACL|nr:fused isobutyryl-CoA mutase/GTPase IcmF [Ferroacidibacillus organovorans]KUO95777.1 methylmalonyl-CoA mutase [Ferroacidibacillus organovorans]